MPRTVSKSCTRPDDTRTDHWWTTDTLTRSEFVLTATPAPPSSHPPRSPHRMNGAEGPGVALALGWGRSSAGSHGVMEASSQPASRPPPAAHEGLSVGQMVLANRPWRLVRDLSKVLVATLASAGFFIVNANAWGISDQLPVHTLLVIAVLAVVGLGVWLAVAHSLWERPSQTRDPALTYRVNAATVLTLVLGLLFAYLVLYVVVLASMALVVPERFMASNLGHPAGFGDYATATWFAASMAVVVGAIGSGLESDEEVHDTVSRYRATLPGDSR